MSATAPLTPADRLTLIIEALYRAVADQGLARGLSGPLIMLICRRVRSLARHFAALAARPPIPRAETKKPSSAARPASGPAPRPPGPLPRHFAWLLRLLPGTAVTGSAVAAARWSVVTLLNDPDTVALVTAVPATGRALRPLCHMLGIRLPLLLRPAGRSRAPAQAATTPAAEPPSAPSSAPCPAHPASPPVRPRPRGGAFTSAPLPLFRA